MIVRLTQNAPVYLPPLMFMIVGPLQRILFYCLFASLSLSLSLSLLSTLYSLLSTLSKAQWVNGEFEGDSWCQGQSGMLLV